MRVLSFAAAVIVFAPMMAFAQQSPQPQAPQQQPPQQQAPPRSNEWANLPRMQLERQFAGPLQDTIIQRWRDPGDGTVCYIYLPITAAHTPPTQNGFVQYGANGIGTISCLEASAAAPLKKPPPAH
jgi:hypothetical protein